MSNKISEHLIFVVHHLHNVNYEWKINTKNAVFSCEKFYFNKTYFVFTFVRYVPALRPLRQQAFLLAFPQTLPSRLAQRLAEVTCTFTRISTIWFCKCLNVDPCMLLFLNTDHKAAGYESRYWHSDGLVWENWQWHPFLHQHITGERDVCSNTWQN